ncbi:hypothetical protein [Sphingomonas sp. BK580]|uniref:hypothetical protein n=1 Tax=Sphingomonas sp. BK580 TaxID=2586972 RepID=UPI00162287DE|nr:hypothetical protein [Sphingomonas sp. BK580]MBB3693556.1 cell division protein FtsB [Sphingomonas sp. BK580]
MSRPKRNEQIAADLHGAIDALVEEGKEITFANVAKRSGRARGLISGRAARYEDVRVRIQLLTKPKHAEAAPPPDVRGSRDRSLIRELTAENEALRRENQRLAAIAKGLRNGIVARAAATAQADLGTSESQMADLERRRAARAARRASTASAEPIK